MKIHFQYHSRRLADFYYFENMPRSERRDYYLMTFVRGELPMAFLLWMVW